METVRITLANSIFQNDERNIKRGLQKLKGIIKIIFKPKKNQLTIVYENTNSYKIISRLYALGYFEEQSKCNSLFQADNSVLFLPQKMEY